MADVARQAAAQPQGSMDSGQQQHDSHRQPQDNSGQHHDGHGQKQDGNGQQHDNSRQQWDCEKAATSSLMCVGMTPVRSSMSTMGSSHKVKGQQHGQG